LLDKKVVIIDYGMGNLFSIKNACAHVGIESRITSCIDEVLSSDGIILPGVGAFGKAIDTLESLGLLLVIRSSIESGKPFMGICLGLQLLMTESCEFGKHKGLNLISGSVKRFENEVLDNRILKVPHVGWNEIILKEKIGSKSGHTFLKDFNSCEYMYFVHSYYVEPEDKSIVLTTTKYGSIEFCSSIQYKNIFACQFHPERSGEKGLQIYRNFRNLLVGS